MMHLFFLIDLIHLLKVQYNNGRRRLGLLEKDSWFRYDGNILLLPRFGVIKILHMFSLKISSKYNISYSDPFVDDKN